MEWNIKTEILDHGEKGEEFSFAVFRDYSSTFDRESVFRE